MGLMDRADPEWWRKWMAQPSTADARGVLHDIPIRQGAILPLTEYGDGSARLDWSAGLPGSIAQAFTAPARAYRGEIAPEQMIPEGLNFAGNVTLGSMAGTKPTGALAAGAARDAGQPKGFIAYHGSPHDFDRFDISKIGTGEGAQAYGHGLYFSDNAKVARAYEGMLTGNGYDPAVIARDALVDTGGDVTAALAKLSKETPPKMGLPEMDILTDNYGTAKSILQDHAAGSPMPLPAKGRMYQVRINADPDHFLDWDKPLSQQSEAVRKALDSANVNRYDVEGPTGPYFGNWTLDEANNVGRSYPGDAAPWRVVKKDFKSSAGLVDALGKNTQALRDAGIPGIKYLDQGSRAAGDGSRNYVVFDDKLIEILRKYGLLGMLGGGAAAMSGGGGAQAHGRGLLP